MTDHCCQDLRARSCAALGAAAALLAINCATGARPAAGDAPSASGFSWTNDDLLIADSTVAQLIEGRRAPRYPDDERMHGGEAGFVAAFVLDTAGRAELQSVSFVGTAPDPFARAVCIYLRGARFAPLRAAGLPVRALVLVPMVFALQGGSWYGKSLDETPVRERFRQEGAARALAEMRALKHCPP